MKNDDCAPPPTIPPLIKMAWTSQMHLTRLNAVLGPPEAQELCRYDYSETDVVSRLPRMTAARAYALRQSSVRVG